MLNIRLLNSFELHYDGELIAGVKSAPMQSLLAYLLIHRDTRHARQQLAYLFWPDSTEAQARTNLRRELHLIRRTLPDADRFLYVDAKVVQWRTDAPFALDVADFEMHVAQAEEAAQDEGDAALCARMEKAVTLYSGDLLPSCYDEWIVPERERLSQLYARLLERLIQLLEQQRDYTAAIRHAQRLRRYDPLHEATYRHLMRLYALTGDRARALRVYHTCVTTMRRELGVDPSAATRESYERLIDEGGASITFSLPRTTVVAEGRLVGRETVWETMLAAWQRTMHAEPPGQAHCVLVVGEAGIGKTRLVEELLEWASQRAIVTAITRCYASEGQLAFGPVADWLAADTFRTSLLALDAIWLTELTRLLPALLVERPELPRPTPLTESGQRLRLFRALAQAVLADSQPLLLVIDDLQWCDRETLEWLHYLLRYEPRRPLLLVGTVRSEGIAENDALRSLQLALLKSDQVTEIELGPLSQAATAELAAQVIGGEVHPEVATHLFAESEGNPLFVVEMARAHLAPGVVRNRRLEPRSGEMEQTEFRAHDHQPLALPARIKAVIQSRVAELSPQAREVVELAATIGRSFTFNVLALASASAGTSQASPRESADDEAVVQGLDELWQRRIIREQEEDAYDFSHDKIREVVYTTISRARQQLLHRRVALALEAAHAADLGVVSGQIARHFERAGVFERAVPYYLRAAEMARRVYANHEAKTLYTHAIEVSQRAVPPLDDLQLLPLYEGRAQVCRSLTQLDEAIADFQIMRQLAHAGGDRSKEGESLCQLAYTHWLTFSEDQMPFVEQYAREATEQFAQVSNQGVLARGLTMLGAVDQVQRRMGDAGRKLTEALAISRTIQDNEALVQTLSFLCLQSYIQGDLQATVRYAQEGVDVARAVQDDFNELRIQAFLCQGLWAAGHSAEAYGLAQEVLAQAKGRGNLFAQGRLLNTLGWFHAEFGDFGRAAELDQESVELGRASAIDNVEISALSNLGYDYLGLGQPERARTIFETTLARAEQEGFGAHKWQWRMKLNLGLAECAHRMGAHEQALRYVEVGLVEAQATSARKYVVKGLELRGTILMLMGNTEAAGADLTRAFALAEMLQIPSRVYPLAFALAKWHEAMSHEHEARTLYAKAKSTAEQMAAAARDIGLSAVFQQSNAVQLIHESWARTL